MLRPTTWRDLTIMIQNATYDRRAGIVSLTK